MAKFGNALELWLNLISINGGLVQLVNKNLEGTVISPYMP